MPQRFLRPGITNSERWNAVSWQDQSLFIRLLTLVDDYGRFDGRPSVLVGYCFSVWNAQNPNEAIDAYQIECALQRLAADSVQLLEIYEVGGKPVLQITQWQERVRDGAREKWPKNPTSQQDAAGRSVPLLPSPSPSPTPSGDSPASDWVDEYGNPIPEKLQTPEFFKTLQLWHSYRRQIRKPYRQIGAEGCLKTLAGCESPGVAIATIQQSIANGWQGLFPIRNQPQRQALPPRRINSGSENF